MKMSIPIRFCARIFYREDKVDSPTQAGRGVFAANPPTVICINRGT